MPEQCPEFETLHRFFHEDHMVTKKVEEQERIKFLKPPSWYGGGKVPKDALYREDNKILLRIEMIPAVDILYAALAPFSKTKELAKTKYNEKEPWNRLPYIENVGTRLIPKILHKCEERAVPQNYAPGVLLLYLEHCEGCQWRHLVAPMLYEKKMALQRVERLRDQGKEDEAKLGPDDWPEYMTTAVAEFVKLAKKFR